jgi:predicted nuclease of predicted toxin-antitoxin system
LVECRISDCGKDRELMRWALENDHIVLTADLDFGAVLAVTQGIKPSVIQIRSELLAPRAIGHVVVRAMHQARQALVDGALISLDASQARLRILPLRR